MFIGYYCSNRKRQGFTLVELLVVISIIALLLSILMPSLSKAREQAKLLICKSNVKQIVLAENLYAYDNQNKLPPLNFAQMRVWLGLPKLDASQMQYIVWADALDHYIKSAQRGEANYKLTCPNFNKVHPGINPWGIDGSPYGQVGFMDNNQDGDVTDNGDLLAGKPLSLLRVKRPAELLIISESFWHPWYPYKTAWGLGGPANSMSYRQYPTLRHKKSGFPLGFLDGHVASYKPVTHPNTENRPPTGVRSPIYWPDVPDEWWLVRGGL